MPDVPSDQLQEIAELVPQDTFTPINTANNSPTKLDLEQADSHIKNSPQRIDIQSPVWMDDNATDKCLLCGKIFTFVRRRHHCRCCGKVFCGDCCSNQTQLRHMNNEPARVCSICYTNLTIRGGISLGTLPSPRPKLPSAGGLLKRDKVNTQRRSVSFSENLETYKAVSSSKVVNSSNDLLFTVVNDDNRQYKTKIVEIIEEVKNDGVSYRLLVSRNVTVRLSRFFPKILQEEDQPRDFFAFVTEGLSSHAHPEVAMIATSQNRARMGNSELIIWIVRVIQQICLSIESGRYLTRHSVVLCKPLNDQRNDSAFIFVDQTYQTVDIGQNSGLATLFGVYIDSDELQMAKIIPRRLILRLFSKYAENYSDSYPCPLFSFIGRPSVIECSVGEESVVSLYTGGTDSVPTVEDMIIRRDLSAGSLVLIFSPDQQKQINNCIKCCVGSTVFMASGSFNDSNNQYAVYRTDSGDSLPTTIDSNILVYTFIIFCSEPVRATNIVKEIEDGLLLLVDSDTFAHINKVLQNQEPLSIPLMVESNKTEINLNISWNNEKNGAVKRTSLIDGRLLDCKNNIFTRGYINCDVINVTAGYLFRLVEILDLSGSSFSQHNSLKNILFILRTFLNLAVKFVKIRKTGFTVLRITLKDSDISYEIGGNHCGFLNSQQVVHDVLLQSIVAKFPRVDSSQNFNSPSFRQVYDIDIEAIFCTIHS